MEQRKFCFPKRAARVVVFDPRFEHGACIRCPSVDTGGDDHMVIIIIMKTYDSTKFSCKWDILLILQVSFYKIYYQLVQFGASRLSFGVWRLAPSLLFHIFQVVQWAKSGLPPSVIVRQRLKLQKAKVEKLWKKCRLKILRSTQLTLPLWKVMQAPFNDHYKWSSKWSPSWWPRWWQSVLWCFPPVPLSWWLTGCGTHFPLPTGCPPHSASAPWQHDFATELDIQKVQRYLWSSFWDTHVPCLRDIAHTAWISLHHRQLITNMTTCLKWIMPIRRRYSTPAHW